MLNQIQSRIDEGGEGTLITVKNVRVFAVFICVFAVLVSLFFGAAKEVAFGVFLGGAAAQLVFRQHEIAIGKRLFSGSEKNSSISSASRRWPIPSPGWRQRRSTKPIFSVPA